MALLIAGMDEAGYGPLLGPLCVGLSVFRVAEAPEGGKLPDLWKVMGKGVCRGPGRGGENDKRGRVAVADSKALKLANSVKCAHPLVHLERGVLAFVRCLAERGGAAVADDAELFAAIGAELPGMACYDVEPRALPVSTSAGAIAIAHNVLSRAMVGAGVELAALRCAVIGEPRYQQIVRDTNNKAETTATAFGDHLRRVWELYGREGEGARLGFVCDRMGGRAQYSGLIERELPGSTVEIVEESEGKSRYAVTAPDASGRLRKAGVSFLVEGETVHLPIALASMVAKFTRELSMMRYNQYYNGLRAARGYAEVKPTAGYRNDAHRWLEDIGDVMSEEEKKVLLRWV